MTTEWEKFWDGKLRMINAYDVVKQEVFTEELLKIKSLGDNLLSGLQHWRKLENEKHLKLEAIRIYVSRALEVSNSLPNGLKKKRYMIDSNELCARILEVLGETSIKSDKKRLI